jgi:hypothetical protein
MNPIKGVLNILLEYTSKNFIRLASGGKKSGLRPPGGLRDSLAKKTGL